MPRIAALADGQTDADTQATLDAIKAKIGMVPNLHRTFAQAPAVLGGYLAFGDALAKGRLTGKQREIIALATAQLNGCHYCLSAHTLLGKGAGLSADAIADARHGAAADATDHAIATLAVQLIETRGRLSDDQVAAATSAGLDAGLIVEIIANTAANILTNYTNNVAETAIDFPVVSLEVPVKAEATA